jgi:hypothetical protein
VIDEGSFVGIVEEGLYKSVDHILGNLGRFKRHGFQVADSLLDLDSIPKCQFTAPLISVKCQYEQGNVQFTLGKAHSSDGFDCVLFECDMDEHSNVIEHVSDLFPRVYPGGTKPIDIHECMVHHQPGIDLGYELQPTAPPFHP